MLTHKHLVNGELSEESMQKAVMQWVRLNPIIKKIVLHFPNEGRRTKYYGKLLKDLGMRAGVSDLFIAKGNHGYHGAWLELKSENGIVSPAQNLFLSDMREQGYFCAVCRSIDETIMLIKWYCI